MDELGDRATGAIDDVSSAIRRHQWFTGFLVVGWPQGIPIEPHPIWNDSPGKPCIVDHVIDDPFVFCPQQGIGNPILAAVVAVFHVVPPKGNGATTPTGVMAPVGESASWRG
jgi:hypothetical protein